MLRENKSVQEMAGKLNRAVRGVQDRLNIMSGSECGGSAVEKSEVSPATEGGHEFGDMSLSTIALLNPECLLNGQNRSYSGYICGPERNHEEGFPVLSFLPRSRFGSGPQMYPL